MIKLSQRLLTIASLVRSDARVVDIGCDHALLDIYLAQQFSDIKVIASDVKIGSIKKAKQNIETYNMEHQITLRLGNGLDIVDGSEINTIIMAGLGRITIVDILTKNKDKLVNVSDLIIQSNTDHYELRVAVCALGYFIANEKIVKDKGFNYLIVHFQKGKMKYHNDDYLLGPILRQEKSDVYREMLRDDINKKEILYSQIPLKYILKRQRLRAYIAKLKQEIKRKN